MGKVLLVDIVQSFDSELDIANAIGTRAMPELSNPGVQVKPMRRLMKEGARRVAKSGQGATIAVTY